MPLFSTRDDDKNKSRLESVILTPRVDFNERVLAQAKHRRHDKRVAERVDTFKMTELKLDGRSKIRCLIKNISRTGAKISCEGSASLPDRIKLFLPTTFEFVDAEVVWRDGKDIGVRFVKP